MAVASRTRNVGDGSSNEQVLAKSIVQDSPQKFTLKLEDQKSVFAKKEIERSPTQVREFNNFISENLSSNANTKWNNAVEKRPPLWNALVFGTEEEYKKELKHLWSVTESDKKIIQELESFYRLFHQDKSIQKKIAPMVSHYNRNLGVFLSTEIVRMDSKGIAVPQSLIEGNRKIYERLNEEDKRYVIAETYKAAKKEGIDDKYITSALSKTGFSSSLIQEVASNIGTGAISSAAQNTFQDVYKYLQGLYSDLITASWDGKLDEAGFASALEQQGDKNAEGDAKTIIEAIKDAKESGVTKEEFMEAAREAAEAGEKARETKAPKTKLAGLKISKVQNA